MATAANQIAESLPIACSHNTCHETKGSLKFYANGDVVYAHGCPKGHHQGFNIKHALRAILRRDPLWVQKVLDES